jgi:hypothetical protein
MRSMIVMLLVSAVGWSSTGCAAQAEQSEGESEVASSGSTASALQKGGGGGTASCPGGGAPSCVTCSDAKCIWACAGGYTCETSQDANTTMCSVKTSTCRTISFAVGSFAGMVAY